MRKTSNVLHSNSSVYNLPSACSKKQLRSKKKHCWCVIRPQGPQFIYKTMMEDREKDETRVWDCFLGQHLQMKNVRIL